MNQNLIMSWWISKPYFIMLIESIKNRNLTNQLFVILGMGSLTLLDLLLYRLVPLLLYRLKVLVVQSYQTFCCRMDCSLPGSSVYGFLARSTGVNCHFLLWGSSQPRIKPGPFALQADSLPSEPPGKPL